MNQTTTPHSFIVTTFLARSLVLAFLTTTPLHAGMPEQQIASGSTQAARNADVTVTLEIEAPFALSSGTARDCASIAEKGEGRGVDVWYDDTLHTFFLTGDPDTIGEATSILRARLDAIARTPRARALFGNGLMSLATERGPLGTLVRSLRETHGLNIVITEPAVLDIVVPAIEIDDVDARTVMKLIDSLPPADGRRIRAIEVAAEQAGSAPTNGRGRAGGVVGSAPVFVLSIEVDGEHGMMSTFWTDVDADEAERMVDTISAIAELEGITDLVKARYHAPTETLFIRGPKASMTTIGNAIEASVRE